jgi:hypothetical protein
LAGLMFVVGWELSCVVRAEGVLLVDDECGWSGSAEKNLTPIYTDDTDQE